MVDSCTAGQPGTEGPFGDPTCSDAADNDCDGATDAADSGCAQQCVPSPEVCDGVDNDCDGQIDNGTEGPFGDPSCSDAADNDCDGFADGNDTNCNATVSDLAVISVSSPPISKKRGSTFNVKAKIKNKGVGAAENEFTIGYYLSKNKDTHINKEADIILNDDIIMSSLLAGASSKGKIPVNIPLDTPVGKYFIKVCADNRFDISETDEDNNCRASGLKIKVK